MRESSKEITERLEQLCTRREASETNVEKVISEVFMRRLKGNGK